MFSLLAQSASFPGGSLGTRTKTHGVPGAHRAAEAPDPTARIVHHGVLREACPVSGRFLELQRVEAFVQGTTRDQLAMRSQIRNVAAVEHENPIGQIQR